MIVKDLRDYKKNLTSELSRELAEFDRNFIFLSSGLLAFSITFIKDIIDIQSSVWISILFASWTSIFISISLIMYNFWRSSRINNRLWLAIDKFINEYKLYNQDHELNPEQESIIRTEVQKIVFKGKKNTTFLRAIAMSMFILGIALMGVFVSINMVHEKNTDKKDCQSGVEIISYYKT